MAENAEAGCRAARVTQTLPGAPPNSRDRRPARHGRPAGVGGRA